MSVSNYVENARKKEAVSASVVRKVVGDYVRVHSLQNSTDRKEVVLDPVMRSATGAPLGVNTLPWDQLVSAVFTQMGHSFKVELGGNEALALTKGKLPPIDIHVGTRSFNKKVGN
ncbi:Eukaryotic translation initiation factor 2D [Homalodisca vitripennis]|nr:Eukaryotic translation initiation factor 2D [Homalodisca vitripennis]